MSENVGTILGAINCNKMVLGTLLHRATFYLKNSVESTSRFSSFIATKPVSS